MEFLATSLPSTRARRTSFAKPGQQLVVEDDGGACPRPTRVFLHRALEVEQVIEEHHPCPGRIPLALAQEKAIAAENDRLG